jgi:cytochrome P450
LFPPVWTLGRKVLEPYTLGGHTLDAGAVVWTSQWVAHRDPRWWQAPNEFRPERWTDAAAPSRPKYAYFPFGGGVHQCVGEGFAWSEAILLLATIGQQWRFETVSDPTPEARLTLRPKGLRMRAIRRAATA